MKESGFPQSASNSKKPSLTKKRSILYSLLDLLTSILLSEFALRILIYSPNDFIRTILAMLFASFHKFFQIVRC